MGLNLNILLPDSTTIHPGVIFNLEIIKAISISYKIWVLWAKVSVINEGVGVNTITYWLFFWLNTFKKF